MRPPNLVTSAADILAGYAAAERPRAAALAFLAAGSVALYAGGVVMNDFFDRRHDATERPERPIPSGRVSAGRAAALGLLLLAAGVTGAIAAGPASGVIAVTIAVLAVLYDARFKRLRAAGPAAMGLCRAFNFLLGLSAGPVLLMRRWPLAALHFAYVAAVTAVSAGEVGGGTRRTGRLAFGFVTLVCIGGFIPGLFPPFRALWAAPFLVLLAWRVLPALRRAAESPGEANVRAAVKSGVLALVVLDAAIAAGYAGLGYGVIVLVLLGAATVLSRVFSVA
jgi:4-hydroxybenzoate polyprenyltransferase